ncbi:tRNA uridine-5-carboxymethylaminomethyl(34) synthesis GTPase MnmE [uncultured Porphyromonas sp.]|uniref:tRNA uridine-5-carboxymethylaminomethyl(34) synthesis GTPase MnmE n=1 Tax=uncultured Porphyromonas sp. TaxID=159274 RepID=UPI002586DABC|nr:tRNA uridine-5-carboxymethylaminomethyl(34) synthesis GTPase MnmE [uncultured Porphyromonas sp.]
MEHNNFEDTICAVATPHGMGAQSTIKVSGTKAIEIVNSLFRATKKDTSLLTAAPYSAQYGWLYDPKDGSRIDDCIILVMRAPHSYTGEDQVEITYHGNPLISQLLLDLLIQAGARMAEPGEFTRRALSNGKLDLSQAEAVADVIASTNRAALRLSITQMRGLFRKKIEELREPLIRLASLIELELDFSEEDVEFVPRDKLLAQCQEIRKSVSSLAESYATSEVIKNGIPIAIVGATNAGKSTLLNGLLNEERAIVSNIHGTTRDTIEDTIYIKGQQFRLVDTAGLRETTDTIEQIGIERTLEKVANTELVLWVIDPTETAVEWQSVLDRIAPQTSKQQIVGIINKIDIAPKEQVEALKGWLVEQEINTTLPICAMKSEGIEQVKGLLHHHFSDLAVADDQLMAINLRQSTALREAAQHLLSVEEGIQAHLSGELIAQDLRAATTSLSTVIGEVTTDTLLSSIFANFCIGK